MRDAPWAKFCAFPHKTTIFRATQLMSYTQAVQKQEKQENKKWNITFSKILNAIFLLLI